MNGQDAIIDLNDQPAEDWIDCDGLITTNPGHVLALYAADCIPLVLWSEAKPLLALVHVGRQGAALELVAKVIEHITLAHGVQPAAIHAWIGPSIKQASYVFRPEDIADRFSGDKWQPFLRTKDGLIQADLLGYVLKQLVDVGVSKESVTVAPVDTGVNDQYFSHYRSKKTDEPEGRNALIVYLK